MKYTIVNPKVFTIGFLNSLLTCLAHVTMAKADE